MAGQRKQSPIVSIETRYGGKKANGKPRKTGVNCVNADGEKFTLLNPSGKSAKYAAEIKRGVCYTSDGRIKRDDKGNAQKLTAKQRAYRAGYLDRGKDSAKAYNSKKEKRATAKQNKKF